ncbi:hypothetical protein FRC03_002537 [Tulasnella sp. 419]|nr:hypothetical protein FRC03_002537 [Tulasnella sp. 419]
MATRIFAKLLRCVRVALNTLSDLKDSALSGIETLWHNLKDEVSPRVTRLKRTVKCKITQSVDGLTERFIPAPLRNWTAQACRSAKSTIEPYLTLITNKIQSSFQTFRSLWKTQVPAWLKVLVSLYMAFWLFMLGVIIFGFTPIGPRAGE